MKREDIEKIYDFGKDATVNFIMQLVERIEKLENQIAKNSRNSSKPPSSDGFKKPKKTRSQRKRSGKKSGGQPGHPGKTLEMVKHPDRIVKLSLTYCTCCGRWIAKAQPKSIEKRQVQDVPKPNLEATEYQSCIADCPYCGTENKAAFPAGVTQKVQYGNRLRSMMVYLKNYQLLPLDRLTDLFRDLFQVSVSEATVLAASERCSTALDDFSSWVVDALKKSPVVNFDETGANIGGSLHWIHTAGTPLLTGYIPHKRRGSEAIDAFGIIPDFTGRAVHDHWSSYFKYPCAHGLCNAHHLRELTYMHEQENQKWAKKMIDCLLTVKASVDSAKEKGKSVLSRTLILKYEKQYTRIVQSGFRENPVKKEKSHQKVKKRGRPGKTKAQNLLHRLRDHQHEVLAFMYDFSVPFDNNLAERDLRMIKVQQKISGLFRTFAGAEQFCRIRSFISTTRKQGVNVIEAISEILKGNQIYLNFATK